MVRDSSGGRISRPFKANRFCEGFPGLKPWAEFFSPFGASDSAIRPRSRARPRSRFLTMGGTKKHRPTLASLCLLTPAPPPFKSEKDSSGSRSPRLEAHVLRFAPEGAGGFSPGFQSGFQPWDHYPKRRALNGRQIEPPNQMEVESNHRTAHLL
jgi:hypothetical protein